jgi:hypothetical protein
MAETEHLFWIFDCRFWIGGKEHEQKALDAMVGFFFRQSKI